MIYFLHLQQQNSLNQEKVQDYVIKDSQIKTTIEPTRYALISSAHRRENKSIINQMMNFYHISGTHFYT